MIEERATMNSAMPTVTETFSAEKLSGAHRGRHVVVLWSESLATYLTEQDDRPADAEPRILRITGIAHDRTGTTLTLEAPGLGSISLSYDESDRVSLSGVAGTPLGGIPRDELRERLFRSGFQRPDVLVGPRGLRPPSAPGETTFRQYLDEQTADMLADDPDTDTEDFRARVTAEMTRLGFELDDQMSDGVLDILRKYV